MDFLTRTELAEQIGLSANSTDGLIETEFIKGTTKIGRTTAIPKSEADRLSAIELIGEHAPVLVVKVRGGKKFKDDPRQWTGWKPGVPENNRDQMDAVRQYWRVKNPDTYVGERLAVTTAGFVHAVYRITGYTTHPGALRAFDITPDKSEEAKYILAHRFPAVPGGTIELR